MKIDILSLFPEMYNGPFTESILKRAQQENKVEINIHNFRDYTEDIHGKALDYSLVIQFINALISKLNDKFESRELFKSEVIGALGPYTFPETINKMYEPSPTGKAYEYYYIAGFSSNPSPTINECLKEMGLEKGMFSKAVRNHGFRVKDRFLSCSYGLGFRVVDLTNNQNIEEFIKKLGIQVDDICINLNEKNTMHK